MCQSQRTATHPTSVQGPSSSSAAVTECLSLPCTLLGRTVASSRHSHNHSFHRNPLTPSLGPGVTGESQGLARTHTLSEGAECCAQRNSDMRGDRGWLWPGWVGGSLSEALCHIRAETTEPPPQSHPSTSTQAQGLPGPPPALSSVDLPSPVGDFVKPFSGVSSIQTIYCLRLYTSPQEF